MSEKDRFPRAATTITTHDLPSNGPGRGVQVRPASKGGTLRRFNGLPCATSPLARSSSRLQHLLLSASPWVLVRASPSLHPASRAHPTSHRRRKSGRDLCHDRWRAAPQSPPDTRRFRRSIRHARGCLRRLSDSGRPRPCSDGNAPFTARDLWMARGTKFISPIALCSPGRRPRPQPRPTRPFACMNLPRGSTSARSRSCHCHFCMWLSQSVCPVRKQPRPLVQHSEQAPPTVTAVSQGLETIANPDGFDVKGSLQTSASRYDECFGHCEVGTAAPP